MNPARRAGTTITALAENVGGAVSLPRELRALRGVGHLAQGGRVGAAGVRLPTATAMATLPTRPALDWATTTSVCVLPEAESGIWTVRLNPELANASPKLAARAELSPNPLSPAATEPMTLPP